MINAVSDLQQLLYQIHSMSKLLFCHHEELIDSGQLQRHDPDDISEPLLSIAEIIKEKTEACLKKAEFLEEHLFREAEKALIDSGQLRCVSALEKE